MTVKSVCCRTCAFVEPTGKGRRGGEEVDIGTCHGDTPKLTTESAGAFPPVTLDFDWCRHHELSTAAAAAKARSKR
jgi:hypothetical protein